MKHYEVVCAIIENDKGEIFCCKRGPGRAMEGFFEFPGGKVEEHETHEQTIVREILEELKTNIEPLEYIGKSDYQYTNMAPYKDFSITLYAYRCKLISGNLELTEHTEKKFVKKSLLNKEEFAPADRYLIDLIKRAN